MSKTKTHHISFNGFPTTLNHPFVISHPRDWRWLSLSLETALLSKKCSRESLNNSLLCLEERLSYIGILEKVWMKCNSLKPNPTWTTWFLNINNIKMPLLKKKANLMKKRADLLLSYKDSKFFFFCYLYILNIFKVHNHSQIKIKIITKIIFI